MPRVPNGGVSSKTLFFCDIWPKLPISEQLNSELPTVVTPSKEYGFIDQINDESSHPLISIPRANFSASQHRDGPQPTTSAGLGRPHRKMSNTSFLSATAAAVKSMNDDERRSLLDGSMEFTV